MRLAISIAAILVALLLTGGATRCNAQSPLQADTIRVADHFLNCTYYYGSSEISVAQLRRIVRRCPEAKAALRYHDAYTASSALFAAAGLMMNGVSIFAALNDDMEYEAWMSVTGGLFLVCSFELFERRYKLRNNAVKAFNDQQMLRARDPKRSLKLAFTPHGVGLVLSF